MDEEMAQPGLVVDAAQGGLPGHDDARLPPRPLAGLPVPPSRLSPWDLDRLLAVRAPVPRVEPPAAVADPADDLRGHARHEPVGGHVLRHDGARRYNRRPP